ncbi:ras-domain-containing protein [Auriscalpium vulgare]|uniref:Ras-domain-containing protein n=1 Tax=Auriscalpium vulgare TaxID=40419 RepID=A0ACB8S8H6_9AGAM|nr:ras-domain-containing protein [Auriscalpium vulgare]
MAAYPRMDPYQRSRYDQGIDAKIARRLSLSRARATVADPPVASSTGVGKTSLLQRYTQNKFDPKNTTSTTGAFFVTKKVVVNGMKVRLQLWDTAGQERFRSMAPMYYRGANAALLLYDITSQASFEDVRGWLEELKRNCPTDLIIYIVGSKADLAYSRQVSQDLARLSLHQWFPPPRPPTPPPPPQPSTFSYIRPRFTSFTSIRSAPLMSPSKPSPPDSHSSFEAPMNRATALKRSQTGAGFPAAKSTGALGLNRAKSTNGALTSRFGSHAVGRPWNDVVDDSHSAIDDYEEDGDDDREWGLEKGMELFEVSAKDDLGIHDLFDTLISAIIQKKDSIEQENDMKRRDSVFLTPVSPPTWAAQAEEEEAREKAAARSGAWSCCQT